MVINMNDSHITSIAQLKELAKITSQVTFESASRKEMYSWVGEVLGRFKYFSLKKKEKYVVKEYVRGMTGLSDAQTGRLIKKKRDVGLVILSSTKRHTFPKRYTPEDIALLIETDSVHECLAGPATKRILEREYSVYGNKKYERVRNLSVSHLYNLRDTRRYRSQTLFFTKTKPVAVPIGERRKPNPEGRPGFIRVDSVHQGDLEKAKGVYHINLVDEVTQWEIVGCAEKISEAYLAPLLEELLLQFPFRILGFHSDNGSEYINKVVAKLLQKLLIRQTKSRPRHSNDNGLVESKNGGVIRKHMGYIHIPQKNAEIINEFYRQFFNPYLNFHRPCGFASSIFDRRGKEKKVYDTYLMPFEKLRTIEKPEKYLKEEITLASLGEIEKQMSDNECAALVKKEKQKLFARFKK